MTSLAYGYLELEYSCTNSTNQIAHCEVSKSHSEAPSLIPGSSTRPADVYLPNWKRGQPAALDVTVISTMQQQTLLGVGLHFQDKEFRLCLQYWLGLRMGEEGAACPVCRGACDAYGDHHVGCGGNGDRIHRHDSIRDAVFSAAQSAALAPLKEAPSLIPGSSTRPADVYLPNWKRGQPAALDVTVISTMQQQTLLGASITPGHALQVGEERKMAAHAAICQELG